jgi:hypothetical protein
MKTGIKYLIVMLLINLISVFSQVDLNKTAQSTMNFLLVSTSPKASAMGEAFSSVGIGVESIFYNPAGLSHLEKQFEITVSYSQWIADINYLSGAVGWNLYDYGVVGIHLMTVDYGVINGTSLISEAERDLYPIGYKDNGQVSNVAAYSAGLSYAKAISREFSVGGTVKLAGQNLGKSLLEAGMKNNNALKLVFDAGVKYITDFKGFMFGMSIRNFSSDLKREEIDEQLPLLFALGGAINLMEVINEEIASDNNLIFAVDFLHQNNYSERVNMGVEYEFLKMVSLRGGYQTNRDLASWSAGVGFNTSVSDYNVEVNYSYSKFEIFDYINRLSVLISF